MMQTKRLGNSWRPYNGHDKMEMQVNARCEIRDLPQIGSAFDVAMAYP